MCIGHLYPDRDKLLTDADTFEKLKDAVKSTSYEHMLTQVSDLPNKEKQSEFQSTAKSIGKP